MNRTYRTRGTHRTHKYYGSYESYESYKSHSWMINAIINLLKDRIFAFDIGQPRLIDPAGVDHLVKPREAVDVVFEAFDCVLRHRSRGEDECPVGELRQD